MAISLSAVSAPSASDLVEACEYALENGFHDVKGMLCTWYVTPCDCNPVNKPDMPRVCLPSEITVESLASEVINGIKAQGKSGTMDADIAAAKVLVNHYPCPE